MKITLSENETMWFLIGTKIHLSFENPGPVEVDIDSLRTDQRQQLIWSLQKGVLKSDKPLQEVTAKPQVAKGYAAAALTAEVKEAVSTPTVLDEANEERRKKLKVALAAPQNTFKKELKTHNVSDLRLMLELEQEGKNRKTTLNLLETAISKHQAEVMKNVTVEDSNAANPDAKKLLGGSKVNWQNIEEIVESEDEEVKINLGAQE